MVAAANQPRAIENVIVENVGPFGLSGIQAFGPSDHVHLKPAVWLSCPGVATGPDGWHASRVANERGLLFRLSQPASQYALRHESGLPPRRRRRETIR